jgi:hypothetical protein
LSFASIELLPGALRADVHLHEEVIGPRSLAGLTIVTDGLRRLGQSEIALTLRRTHDADPDVPISIQGYLKKVFGMALAGRIVDEGGISGTLLGSNAPATEQTDTGAKEQSRAWRFGPFAGVIFSRGSSPASLGLGSDVLTAVLATEPELAMAGRCSVNRVLTRLGLEARFFPWPYWADTSRNSVYSHEDVERSILARLGHLYVSSAALTVCGDEVRFNLPTGAGDVVAAALDAGKPLAVLVGRNTAVGSAFVWLPNGGPAGIHAPGADGSVMAGWFLILNPGGVGADEIRFPVEDGIAALLTRRSTRKLIKALRECASIRIRSNQMSRTLELTPTAETWNPPSPSAVVQLGEVEIVAGDLEFGATVPLAALRDLGHLITAMVQQAYAANSVACGLVVRATINTTGSRFGVLSQLAPNAPKSTAEPGGRVYELMAEIYGRLAAGATLASTPGELILDYRWSLPAPTAANI